MPLRINHQQYDRQTRLAESAKKRRYRAPSNQKPLPEFVGVDGEGTGRDNDHRYVLLGVGDRQYENPLGIHWQEAFEFLYECFSDNPTAVYVGFFLSYDFNQILKSLPRERAEMLLTEKGRNARQRRNSGANRKPFPVRHNGWEFDMLPGRRLQLRPLVCECYLVSKSARTCNHTPPKWMYICDAGAFWQTSLINVLDPAKWEEPVCSESEYRLVLRGKEHRATAQLDDEMRRYNRLENELFARAMCRLSAGFRAIDINLSKSQWFGPGQAAANWMRDNGIPTRADVETKVPSWFLDAAKWSYYGGWFEIFCHGIVPGRSYEYDLNSAYPAIIQNLPCLLHGDYSRGNDSPPADGPSDYVLVRCTATAANGTVGAMPHRTKDGHILRPRITSGWHWGREVREAIHSGVITNVEYHEWVAYHSCDCLPPARRVSSLYERRLTVGKNSVLGIAAKLVYNSMYGKFAQAIGQSPYGNWVYASLITSGCRERILEAIGSHPNGSDSLLMVATDGVFFDAIHPGLPLSNKLGEWEETTRDNLALFKPGVYWDDDTRAAIDAGDSPKFKARGVNAKQFAIHLNDLDGMFIEWCDGEHIPERREKIFEGDTLTAWAVKGWPSIVFEAGFNMTTIVQALQRNDWTQAGQTRDHVQVKQSSTPYEKRDYPVWNPAKLRVETSPRELIDIQTTYYDKRYGMEDPFSWEYKEAYGVHFETDYGAMLNQWVDQLKKGNR